jgi:hypothetical protein
VPGVCPSCECGLAAIRAARRCRKGRIKIKKGREGKGRERIGEEKNFRILPPPF